MLDVIEQQHSAILVLEHARGRDLKQIVEEDGSRSEAIAREFGLQICEVMNYLHQQEPPILHRDLTPDNLVVDDKRAYIVLEYLPGLTLRQTVENNGPLTESEVLQLALEMACMLNHLHGQSPPVVHRDFTPENLIQHPDGRVKLMDFSVASRTGPDQSGYCVDKHCYTPPEQFRSQTCPQSDIYALGATVFFLLPGKDPKPISQSNPQAIRQDVSQGFSCIIARATALDLTARYESIEWLRLDLVKLLQQTQANEPARVFDQDAFVTSIAPGLESDPGALQPAGKAEIRDPELIGIKVCETVPAPGKTVETLKLSVGT